MIKSRYCVVWTCDEGFKVLVQDVEGRSQWLNPPGKKPGEFWCDPIGASHSQWHKMTDAQRAQLMLETAIDLAMEGYDLAAVLREFSKVDAFHALGGKSHPMCRALTKAIIGRALEAETMSFEELLTRYAPEHMQ
jgi:hypothetical protein